MTLDTLHTHYLQEIKPVHDQIALLQMQGEIYKHDVCTLKVKLKEIEDKYVKLTNKVIFDANSNA